MTPPHRPLHLTGAYCAYLVRMWQEHPQSPWRASAQNAQTGESRIFADLAALFAFLKEQTISVPSTDGNET